MYRPGSCPGNDLSLIQYLDSTLDTVKRPGTRIILIGNFNVHNEKEQQDAAAGELLEDVCTIHDLQRHVPTSNPRRKHLIISNYDDQTCCTAHPPIGQSDHSCVVADFPLNVEIEPQTTRTVWRYGAADWPRLRHYFASTNWDELTQCNADE